MPNRVKQCCSTTAHTTLGATLYSCLEMLDKRNHTRMESFTIANRATQSTDTASIDTNTCTLTHILDNGAGSGINRI